MYIPWHWKFFELERFAQHEDSQNITKASPLKLQWLDFLLNCSYQSEIPKDRDEVIKESYHVMDKMFWNPDDKIMHWKRIINEQEWEQLLAEKEAEGLVKGRAGIIKVALEYSSDADLEENFQISSKTCNKIKALPKPPRLKDIEKILIEEYTENNWAESSVNVVGDSDIAGNDGGLS